MDWREDVVVSEVVVVAWVRVSQSFHASSSKSEKEQSETNHIDKEQTELVRETLRHQQSQEEVTQSIAHETKDKRIDGLELEVKGKGVVLSNEVQ